MIAMVIKNWTVCIFICYKRWVYYNVTFQSWVIIYVAFSFIDFNCYNDDYPVSEMDLGPCLTWPKYSPSWLRQWKVFKLTVGIYKV